VFKMAFHLSLHGASSIQSTPLHPVSLRSILILSSHLQLGLPSCVFPTGFHTRILYEFIFSPIRAACPAHLILFVLYSGKSTRFAAPVGLRPQTKIKKTNFVAFSPRANYTDRSTAACRRSECQLLRIEGCRVVSAEDPYCRKLGFLDRNRYFSFK
jgi:hypothetical protein